MKKNEKETYLSFHWLLRLAFIAVAFFLLGVIGETKNVEAAGKLVAEGGDFIGRGEKLQVDFSTKTKGIIVIECEAGGPSSKKKMQIVLDAEGSASHIEKETVTIPKLGSDYTWNDCFYSRKKQTPGNYRYTIKNLGSTTIAIDYKISVYSTFTNYLKVKKAMSLKTGDIESLTLKSASSNKVIQLKKVYSTNEAIAKIVGEGACANKYFLNIKGKKAGTCSLVIVMSNGNKYRVKITVKKHEPYIKWNSISHYVYGDRIQNKLYNASGVTWSSSDSSVASVSQNGLITMGRKGNCVITASYQGKKYTCKVKVDRLWPNFTAYLIKYDTRNNCFVMKVKNKGKKTITFLSGSKVENCNYKEFDRSVYLRQVVAVKAGEKKNLYFYVKDGYTWPEVSEYTVFCKIRYGGITYDCHVWNSDSCIKVGKKWYDTYWEW